MILITIHFFNSFCSNEWLVNKAALKLIPVLTVLVDVEIFVVLDIDALDGHLFVTFLFFLSAVFEHCSGLVAQVVT